MTRNYPIPSPLAESVAALERGDWRPTRHIGVFDGHGQEKPAVLVAALRDIAAGLWHHALGEVHQADRRLTSGLALLATIYRGCSVRGMPAIPGEPSLDAEDGLAHLLWRTARIIWREKTELASLQKRFREIPPREMLVLAYVEHLDRVEFDPFTWVEPFAGTEVERVAYEAVAVITRSGLCARASDLRHFAEELDPDVSFHVWKDLGGQVPLRRSALRELSTEPLAAWQLVDDHHRDVPVRVPRQRAWQHAQQWSHDVDWRPTDRTSAQRSR